MTQWPRGLSPGASKDTCLKSAPTAADENGQEEGLGFSSSESFPHETNVH